MADQPGAKDASGRRCTARAVRKFGDDYVQRSGEHASRMSHAQAAEFAERLLSLVEEYFAPGRGDRSGLKYGFQWILTPVDLHPFDD